jgi:hypothetical protein
MDADRAQSPTAGSAEGDRTRRSTSDEAGPGHDGVHGGLDLLDRSDGPWIPIDPPADRSRPDTHTDRSRSRRRLTLAYGAALALLVAGLVVAVTGDRGLHRTDDQLAALRIRLHQTIDRAHQAEQRLGAVTAQSTAAGTTLAAETAQLTASQAQLASTEANVFTNGVSINQLDTCLAGVERALNQISLNDQRGAAASLDGVAAACRAAEPSP